MSNKIRLPNSWVPRPYQLPAWSYLENGGKRACLVWHRRSGKDDIALNRAAVAAHERVGEYWHMLPEYSQGRKVIWEAVSPHTGVRRIDQAFPKELREKTREDEMMIRFKNGSLWRVVGSDNYNSLVGATPVGVVFSEWALANPAAWAFLRPILAENGGWAVFIFTPRGANHGRKTYDLSLKDPEWFGQILRAQETGVFTPEALEREKRDYVHDYGEEEGEGLFNQEYECSFASPLFGSFYGTALNKAEREGRLGKVAIDRAVPVDTAWDLGFDDSNAIWFVQRVSREVRFVDYIEASGVGLDEYARRLEKKKEEHGWVYGEHFFPHDVAHHELSSGKSRVDTLRGLKIDPIVVEQHNVNDGINAVRRMLDRAWFDSERCERGLNALRNYRREWDEDNKIFKPKPLHDWASHGADAARTFAAGADDPQAVDPKEVRKRDRGDRPSAWAA